MRMFFKNMKGRARNKKGSSLLAVVATMAILSIVCLCAAGIALTNYKTSQTITSQDSYYYTAITSQGKLVSHINDVANDVAISTDWTEDNAYSRYYQKIKDAADTFQSAMNGTVYNGDYTATNEVLLPESGIFANDKSCEFIIKTTVTDSEGKTQVYTSTVKVITPQSTSDQIITDATGIFNTEYAVVANGSSKNTDWYGLWGGFNTYYTQKVAKNSPVSSTKNLSKIYTSEASTLAKGKGINASGIFQNAGTGEGESKNPQSYAPHHKFATGSAFGMSDAADRVNGITINVKGAINAASSADDFIDVDSSEAKNISLTKTTSKKTITLNSSAISTSGVKKYYSATEKYYDSFNGNVELNFGATVQTVRFSGLEKGEFYRVICDSSGKSHGMAYQLDTNKNGTVDTKYTSSWGTNYTYVDHYYTNKFFFLDLKGTGTLTINNRTTVTDIKNVNSIFGYADAVTHYVKDAWDNYNGVARGNIVLENCYFFVNGNIVVGNGYNMSNCKVFATGDITMGSVYYLEGLLSSETAAGSDIIKQSLYYCEGLFESKLISRYGMEWALLVNSSYYQNLSGGSIIFSNWQVQCLLNNGNTYRDTVWFTTYEGFLATYRYPTILKAVIIAKGSETITTSGKSTSNGSVSDKNVTATDVSVYLNPNGSTTGVVDTVLIEGQIYSKGKIFVCNYNGAVKNSSGIWANRYAASCQIQFIEYLGDMTIEEINNSFAEDIYGGSPVIVQNGGLQKA
ncbi:MAG: hypothetical protein IKU25_09180 [Clostridia bacterium]|nr:hypothetical protein [Clostridia bacterium]